MYICKITLYMTLRPLILSRCKRSAIEMQMLYCHECVNIHMMYTLTNL